MSWRKRVGVEPTTRLAKSRIAGFEGREDHRIPFASAVCENNQRTKFAEGAQPGVPPTKQFARGGVFGRMRSSSTPGYKVLCILRSRQSEDWRATEFMRGWKRAKRPGSFEAMRLRDQTALAQCKLRSRRVRRARRPFHPAIIRALSLCEG